MSLAVPNVALGQHEGRANLAAAVDGLVIDYDGESYTLAGHPEQPVAASPLDAFVVWEHTEWINPYARRVTWFVYVLLPQTYPLPVGLADEIAERVGSAVLPYGRISRTEPVSLALDTNQPPAPAVRVTIDI